MEYTSRDHFHKQHVHVYPENPLFSKSSALDAYFELTTNILTTKIVKFRFRVSILKV